MFLHSCDPKLVVIPFADHELQQGHQDYSKTTPTYGDGPLDSAEVGRASTLLLRAVKHGQSHLIMETIKKAPNQKPLLVPVQHALTQIHLAMHEGYQAEPPSSMNDASKRRLPDGDDESAWELPTASYAGSSIPTSPWPQESDPLLKAMSEYTENTSIPLPKDIPNIQMWGNCLCETDKYVKAKLSYFEMVAMGETDGDMQQYLQFIVNRYGYTPGEEISKLTPGRDWARFLQRYGWQKTSTTGATFTRRFK